MILNIFSYVHWPSICLLRIGVYSDPLSWIGPMCLIRLFVFLMLSSISSLYILEINPLSDVSLANMFFYSVGSPFILLIISLAVQKLFNLIQSHLFNFSFVSLALGDISAKNFLHQMSDIFMVSWLRFKHFILFEFVFVYGVSW